MSERVYQRKSSGKWEARYPVKRDSDGKVKYRTVYGDTREEAIERRKFALGYDPMDPRRTSELNILILGAGSFGREAKEVLQRIRVFNRIDFLDDNLTGDEIRGRCVDVELFSDTYRCAFVAIADNDVRRRYSELLIEKQFMIPTIISPDAIVSPNAKIGMGTMVFSQANVSSCTVGSFSLLQGGCRL